MGHAPPKHSPEEDAKTDWPEGGPIRRAVDRIRRLLDLEVPGETRAAATKTAGG